jgi:hypothetical protein
VIGSEVVVVGLIRTRPLRRFDDVTTSVNLSTTAIAPHPLSGGFVELLPILPPPAADYGQVSGWAKSFDPYLWVVFVDMRAEWTFTVFPSAVHVHGKIGR